MNLLRNNTSNRSVFTPKTFNQISVFAFQIKNWKSPICFILPLFFLTRWFIHCGTDLLFKFTASLGNLKELQGPSTHEQALVNVKHQRS